MADQNGSFDSEAPRLNGKRPQLEPETRRPRFVDAVALHQIPSVFALYRYEDADEHPDDGVCSWVFALPDGRVYILPADPDANTIISSEDLASAGPRWASRLHADLVAVAHHP
ncbi:MAG: hypothetical protein ACRDT6_19195 [Micromonosporaceae bacterium]